MFSYSILATDESLRGDIGKDFKKLVHKFHLAQAQFIPSVGSISIEVIGDHHAVKHVSIEVRAIIVFYRSRLSHADDAL